VVRPKQFRNRLAERVAQGINAVFQLGKLSVQLRDFLFCSFDISKCRSHDFPSRKFSPFPKVGVLWTFLP
jgi:hypothetical protein